MFFVLGLIIGSFLNVVVLRTKKKESFFIKRSHCVHCKHVLGFLDLVPLFSYIFLKGRCGYCHKKISPQYFLMELATGTVFLFIYLFSPNYFAIVFNIVISCFLIIIFLYDLKYYLILDKFTLPAMVVALLGNLLLGKEWWDLGLGALIGGGFFFFQYIISKGRWIGGGDIRLGILMGLILGWQAVLLALFMAYAVGAIWGVALIIKKRKKLNDPMPFGTFLTAATFTTMLFGQFILDWYLGLLL